MFALSEFLTVALAKIRCGTRCKAGVRVGDEMLAACANDESIDRATCELPASGWQWFEPKQDALALARAQVHTVTKFNMLRQQPAVPERVIVAAGHGATSDVRRKRARHVFSQARRTAAAMVIPQAVGPTALIGMDPALEEIERAHV